MNSNKSEIQIREIDLWEILDLIWKKKMIILLVTVLTAAASWAGTKYFIEPKYRANFTVFVNNRSTENETQLVSSADTIAAQSLTYTYSALIMNRSVLIPAAKEAGLDYSEEHLKRMVSADIEEKTQLINVHVTGSSPEECLNFAAEIARQAPAYVEGIIEGTSMKIVSDPVTTGRSVYPDVRKNTALGGAAGFAVTFLILLILMISDTKVKDIKELEDLYEVPAVGTIPRIGERGARNA